MDVMKVQMFCSFWNLVGSSRVSLPERSRARLWDLLRVAKLWTQTSYSVPKSLRYSTRSEARKCEVAQCSMITGEFTDTGWDFIAYRTFGSACSMLQTVS